MAAFKLMETVDFFPRLWCQNESFTKCEPILAKANHFGKCSASTGLHRLNPSNYTVHLTLKIPPQQLNGTILISWKAQGNTPHVIIMSIVCAVRGDSASWRVWVEIKRRGSFTDVLMHGNTQRFRRGGTSRAHTMRVHTWNTNKCTQQDTHTHTEWKFSWARWTCEDHEDLIDFSVYVPRGK